MAIILGLVSQKGGVGKSTLARAIAREACNSGWSVLIADLDTQQGTCTNWQRRRLNAKLTPTFSVQGFSSAKQALNTAENYDLLILDGAPRASKATLDIAQKAHLVIQPTGASIDDLDPAILLFHELVQNKIPKQKLVCALCRISTQSEATAAKEYIQEANHTVLNGCTTEKSGYRIAQNQGKSITETSYPSLNEQADNLIQSIINKLSIN